MKKEKNEKKKKSEKESKNDEIALSPYILSSTNGTQKWQWDERRWEKEMKWQESEKRNERKRKRYSQNPICMKNKREKEDEKKEKETRETKERKENMTFTSTSTPLFSSVRMDDLSPLSAALWIGWYDIFFSFLFLRGESQLIWNEKEDEDKEKRREEKRREEKRREEKRGEEQRRGAKPRGENNTKKKKTKKPITSY